MLRVFISFWNAGPFLSRCLLSLQSQSFTDWTAHLYDDASTDTSQEIAKAFADSDERFKYIRNTSQCWQAGNLYAFSRMVNILDSDIVFQLDGDDWLPDTSVLQRFITAYEIEPELCVAYGSFIKYRDGTILPGLWSGPIEDYSGLRSAPWVIGSPKSYRMGLLRKLAPADFHDDNGDPIKVAADLATMFPIIEMAGIKRTKWLPSANYVYNMDNSLRTPTRYPGEQDRIANLIRRRAPYLIIENLESMQNRGRQSEPM
jgi:glycosyltransferase involved in cell wall biosynthesis